MSDTADVAASALDLARKLAEIAADIIDANMAGDPERERQAILRANRLTSDELARRESQAAT